MLRVVSLMASATEILLPGSSRLGSSQVIILGRHHRSSRRFLLSTVGLLTILGSACGSRESAPFFKVRAVEGTIWLVGGRSYVSQDRGKSWDSRDFGFICDGDHAPSVVKHQISICGPKTLFHTLERALKVSEDGGRSWRVIPFAKQASRGPAAVFFRDRLKGLVSDLDGHFYATEDGGSTWVEVKGPYRPSGAVFRGNSAWVVASRKLWKWDDSGAWSLVCKLASTLEMTACGDALWIGGYDGYVVSYGLNSGELKTYEPPVSAEHGVRATIEDIGCTGSGVAILTTSDLLVLPRGGSKWHRMNAERFDAGWALDGLDGELIVAGGQWRDWLLEQALRPLIGGGQSRSWKRFAVICQSSRNGGCKALSMDDAHR